MSRTAPRGGNGDPGAEALAARAGAGLIELSWMGRSTISGPRAEEFLSRLVTCDVAALAPGKAQRTLWLGDAGAVRGLGTLVRLEADSFLLHSESDDRGWIAEAAALFETAEKSAPSGGALALVGPCAGKILAAADLAADLTPFEYRRGTWQGAEIAISRIGLGYEIWCKPKTAVALKEHVLAAGKSFALKIARRGAFDILALECGLLRSGADFTPARDGFAATPGVSALGLDALIAGRNFNGRTAYLRAALPKRFTGILFDGETPAPHTALRLGHRPVGTTLSALYSPALQGAAALAVVDGTIEPGTRLSAGEFSCRTTTLPLLPLG
jgi:aminomethyltransferase